MVYLNKFFPINALSKHKWAIRRAMRKPCYIYLKRFAALLMGINNSLPLFPGSDPTKNIPAEEINDILPPAVPNRWERQSYLQGWDFKIKTYREIWAMFGQMGISDQVYKIKSHLKNIIRLDAKRDSHVRKRKGVEATSATNLEKGCAGKRKTKMQSLWYRRRLVQGKHACCMAPDTPLSSVQYLKNILKSVPCSGPIKITNTTPAGKKWCSKSIGFNSSIKEYNIIDHGDTIPKKKSTIKMVKNCESESAKQIQRFWKYLWHWPF